MARSKEENAAIREKVELLMREGFEEDQATAIAFRMFRDGELKIDRRQARPQRPQRQQQRLPSQAQKAQNAMRQANLANSIYQLFKLVMKK